MFFRNTMANIIASIPLLYSMVLFDLFATKFVYTLKNTTVMCQHSKECHAQVVHKLLI